MIALAESGRKLPANLKSAALPRWSQLAQAWSVKHVRRGFFGTLLITIGSLTPAYLPRNSPWWKVMRFLHLDNTPSKLVGTLLVLAGLALLVEAWFRLRPPEVRLSDKVIVAQPVAYHNLRHWAVLAIWGAPFLLAPPIFSHDAYSYAAQGWLIHNGINPYEAGPGVLPGAFADQVAWVWRFTPAPYGPLSLQIQHLLVDISGYDPYVSALLMRIPALIGVGLIGLLLPRLAVKMRIDPGFAAWFGTLNPVLVIDFIGGAHNDSLMMGLVVLALWITRKWFWGWLPAAVIVGVAAAVKQPALLAAYALPFVHRPWRRIDANETITAAGRVLLSMALAIGTFAIVSVMTGLGFGWYNAVNVPGMVVTVSPFTVLGQGLHLLFSGFGWDSAAEIAVRYSRAIGLIASVATLAVLAVTVVRRRPIAFLAWGYLAVAIFGPALHSWYVLWGGLLLPLTKPSRRVIRIALWSTIILLSYAAINISWRNGAVALGVAALAGYFWQLHLHDRRAARATPEESHEPAN